MYVLQRYQNINAIAPPIALQTAAPVLLRGRPRDNLHATTVHLTCNLIFLRQVRLGLNTHQYPTTADTKYWCEPYHWDIFGAMTVNQSLLPRASKRSPPRLAFGSSPPRLRATCEPALEMMWGFSVGRRCDLRLTVSRRRLRAETKALAFRVVPCPVGAASLALSRLVF